MTKSTVSPIPQATPAFPLHEHPAFDDLRTRLQFLQRGAAALKGVGAMLLSHAAHTYSMDAVQGDAAAVFDFFGEAMAEPANEAYNDMERLQRATRGESV